MAALRIQMLATLREQPWKMNEPVEKGAKRQSSSNQGGSGPPQPAALRRLCPPVSRASGILFLFVLLTLPDMIVAELQSSLPFPPPNSSPGHEDAFQNVTRQTDWTCRSKSASLCC